MDMFISMLTALPQQPLTTAASVVGSIFSWLHAAGYDHNIDLHYYESHDDALNSQHHKYFSVHTAPVLMQLFINERCGDTSLLTLNSTQIRLTDDDKAMLSSHGLGSLTLPQIRLRFMFLRKYNSLLQTLLPLIDMRRSDDISSIAWHVHRCKVFIFPSVKTSLTQSVLDATAEPVGKTPHITVNRVAIAHRRERGETIDFIKHTCFGNSYRQMKSMDPFTLRPVRPHGAEPFLAFEIIFKQEQVHGEGGPYRQFFTDVGRELSDLSICPLFCQTPNGRHKLGENQNKLMIRPSATTSTHLSLFVHIGVLFGCCIRTGVRLPLDLSMIVWKGLVGDELTVDDIEDVDKAFVGMMKYVSASSAATDDEDRTFITDVSDGTIVALKPDGATLRVNANNRDEFIQLALAARLCEQTQQIEAIRRGVSRIVPLQILSLMTANELAVLITGNAVIDIALLARHTEYSAGLSADSPEVRYFWNVLHSFDSTQRQLFIRFAWAQDRLPADDEEFARSHTRMMIKPAMSHGSNVDSVLPRSDTCFFNVELPAYSSEAVMRRQLLYSMLHCSTMNADDAHDDPHDIQSQLSRGGGRNARRYDEED